MIFKRKKKLEVADLSWLSTDMHSHLIPGIDDGSPDMETSLVLIRGMKSLGYKKLITTPHIFWEMYPNSAKKIKDGELELREALKLEGIEIELHAAAEYFMDDHFSSELANKTPLLTISENKVLVEFSMIIQPFNVLDNLFEMQIQNYQPVLAHPERYSYLSRNRSYFDELKNAGCLFQLNLLSLTGHYGSTVKDLSEYLLKKGYYDYAGTDLHHERHLQALEKLNTADLFSKVKQATIFKNQLLA
jgi:tyrosine-protein phosphatase YwqE